MVPFASPVTVLGLVLVVQAKLPGLETVVYEVIGLPPLDAGAVKVTVAFAFPPVAVLIVGAPGTVMNVAVIVCAATTL